jgi:hypothetical protein
MKHASSKAREAGYIRLYGLGLLLVRLLKSSSHVEQMLGPFNHKARKNFMQLYLPPNKRGGKNEDP